MQYGMVNTVPELTHKPFSQQGGRWSKAKEKVRGLLNSLSKNSEVALFLLSGRLSTPFLVPDSIQKIIDTLRVSYLSLRLKDGEKIKQVLETARYEREIYLFTDLTKDCFSLLKERPKASVFIVDVGEKGGKNCGIEAVYLKEKLALPQEANHIAGRIKNYSEEEMGLRVELFLGERRESREIVLKPKEEKEITFARELKEPGRYSGKVEIFSDSLAVDNVRYFNFKKMDKIPLLLLWTDRGEVSFLEKALAPSAMSPFELTTLPISGIRGVNLNSFKVVILTNPTNLSLEDKRRVDKYLSEGGSVFLILYSPLKNPSLWDRYFSYEGNKEEEGFLRIEKVDTQHVIFEILKEDIKVPKIFSYSIIKPNQAKVLAHLTGGIPFILEGKGDKILVLTTLLLPKNCDLVFRGVFIPFLYRSLFYLTGYGLEKEYLCGDTIKVAISSPVISIKTPQGVRTERGEIKEGRIEFGFGQTEIPGLYEIGNEVFAVNPDPAEGDLTQLSWDLIPKYFKVIKELPTSRIDLAPISLYLAFIFLSLEFLFLIL